MLSQEDKTRIFNAVCADKGFMKEFVDDFIHDLPTDLTAIDDALQRRDPLALERAAHGLKSVVGLFQAMVCYDLARELEVMGKTSDFENAAQKFTELKSSLKDLTENLEKSN